MISVYEPCPDLIARLWSDRHGARNGHAYMLACEIKCKFTRTCVITDAFLMRGTVIRTVYALRGDP